MNLKKLPATHQHHLKPSHQHCFFFLLVVVFLLILTSLLLPSPPPPNFPPSTTTGSSPLLRIYIYDLPSSFNSDWLSDPRCRSHLFASEVALHLSILRSPFRTTDPSSAHLFLVPVYVSCNFSTLTGFPSLSHARPLLSSAVELISTLHPFWNHSSGSDHLFIASHDHGACFHAVEPLAAAAGIPSFLSNSILLQTFGLRRPHPCQHARHVLIPPYVTPDLEHLPLPPHRDIFAFFRGKMELHPKNISGHFYGNRVRTEIWRRYNGDRRFYLRRKSHRGYREEMARAIFCLCPRGWAPWSPRVVEAVVLGCVPVLVADGIRLPFPEAVPWPEISLAVPEERIGEMGKMLAHVAATNLTTIQRRLWGPEVRNALLFHPSIKRGDATWNALTELARMVGSVLQ